MGQKVGRTLNRLTALQVQKASTPGYKADGGGLYLQVGPAGNKNWVFRFARQGRAREMGLGPLHTVSLANARDKALECRKQLLDGVDPIEARDALQLKATAAAAKVVLFRHCAETYIEAHRAGWKNVKHGEQWANTLTTYAYPLIGALPVASVDTGLVMKVLEPIWLTKTETANRLRGRIESVLDWATVRGFRSGDNPARWRGHLDQLLPKPAKVAKVVNHPALPYSEIGPFMVSLRAEKGTAARVLEFIILTAVRTSEAINARWKEFDLNEKVWTIPADRMKVGREHRVPLSTAAIKLLGEVNPSVTDESAFVFPGLKEGKPLSNMACLSLLKRMQRTDITTHGFRSSFRDWAAEMTNYPAEVAEMALAHTVASKVEAAYRRGDLFDKRRKLMQAWSDYCKRIPATDNVASIGSKKAA